MGAEKNKYVFTKATYKDASKGKFTLKLDQKQVIDLIEELTAKVENEHGVTLDMYTGEQKTKDGSRSFESTKILVRASSAPGQGRPQEPSRFTPKAQPSTDDKIAALKSRLNGKGAAI